MRYLFFLVLILSLSGCVESYLNDPCIIRTITDITDSNCETCTGYGFKYALTTYGGNATIYTNTVYHAGDTIKTTLNK